MRNLLAALALACSPMFAFAETPKRARDYAVLVCDNAGRATPTVAMAHVGSTSLGGAPGSADLVGARCDKAAGRLARMGFFPFGSLEFDRCRIEREDDCPLPFDVIGDRIGAWAPRLSEADRVAQGCRVLILHDASTVSLATCAHFGDGKWEVFSADAFGRRGNEDLRRRLLAAKGEDCDALIRSLEAAGVRGEARSIPMVPYGLRSWNAGRYGTAFCPRPADWPDGRATCFRRVR